MKVIFLDFDGVLNSHAWFDAEPSPKIDEFDPACVARVDKICRRSGAVVVISSSWRSGTPFHRLADFLMAQGLQAKVVGTTPADYQEKFRERGDEIEEWISRNRKNLESFVILDDDGDMGKLKKFLVQTDPKIGITDADVDSAVAILEETVTWSYPKKNKQL
jgi:hypothetical protein